MKNKVETIGWKIINGSESDTAEIEFYGTVVEETPRDLWTDEELKEKFISLEKLTEKLEELKTKKEIIIRINSRGGDFFAGLTIHNLLKSLNVHKTVIIDGLAASAASIIACAGDDVQLYPGSMIMIHPAKIGLCGRFDEYLITQVLSRLKSCKTSMLQIYKSKCGKEENEIDQLINAETWFVGQEAVDNGFANTLIQDSNFEVKKEIENNGKTLIVNGIKHDVSTFNNMPVDILNIKQSFVSQIKDKIVNVIGKKDEQTVEAQPDKQIQKIERNEDKMFKTVDELKQACPDLVAQIVKEASSEAVAEAVKNERARIKEIEEIEATIGNDELVSKAKFSDEETMNAKDLAFIAMKNQQTIGVEYLEKIKTDNEAAKTNTVAPQVTKDFDIGNETAKAVTQMSAALKEVGENR